MAVEVGSRTLQAISGANAKTNLGAVPVAKPELILQINTRMKVQNVFDS